MDVFRNSCVVIFTLFHLITLVLTSNTNVINQSNESQDNENSQSNQLNENNVATDTEIEQDDKRDDGVLTKHNRILQGSNQSWHGAEVPYYLDPESYDEIIARRMRAAMDEIERYTCLRFKKLNTMPMGWKWLHITNPNKERECVHQVQTGPYGEAMVVLGYDCMRRRDILHLLMHALGFKDEVTHPQRDHFIRILWENIPPKYRPLFHINMEETPYKGLVEYDSMSIMHFHDRAFTLNGRPTIAPQVPGLIINPSEEFSQLDIMKLRLAFVRECNKYKVSKLVDTCKNVMRDDHSKPTHVPPPISSKDISSEQITEMPPPISSKGITSEQITEVPPPISTKDISSGQITEVPPPISSKEISPGQMTVVPPPIFSKENSSGHITEVEILEDEYDHRQN